MYKPPHFTLYIVYQNFVSHENIVRFSILWQMEEYRLENGPIEGHLRAVHTSHIQLAHSFRSRGIFKRGKSPKNAYVFASVQTGLNGPRRYLGIIPMILAFTIVFIMIEDLNSPQKGLFKINQQPLIDVQSSIAK